MIPENHWYFVGRLGDLFGPTVYACGYCGCVVVDSFLDDRSYMEVHRDTCPNP